MHATVIVSSMDGPPCSWGTLIREDFFSLNNLQNQLRCHLNYNTLIGGHQLQLSFASYPEVLLLSCWNWMRV